MSDMARAFLADVLAHPGDDAPRLIYADWLDEHAGMIPCPECRGPVRKNPPGGVCPICFSRATVPDGRAARAEFIRVQCELAKTPDHRRVGRGEDEVVDNPRFFELHSRARELLKANWPRWDWGLEVVLASDEESLLLRAGQEYQHPVLSLRRGFVEAVTCTAADWLAHGDAVRQAQPVTRVRLTTILRWGPEGTRDPSVQVEVGRNTRYGLRLKVRGRRGWYLDREHGMGRDWQQILLAAEWPGITFEVPALEPAGT